MELLALLFLFTISMTTMAVLSVVGFYLFMLAMFVYAGIYYVFWIFPHIVMQVWKGR